MLHTELEGHLLDALEKLSQHSDEEMARLSGQIEDLQQQVETLTRQIENLTGQQDAITKLLYSLSEH